MPVAQHVAQARVVARVKHRRELVGRPRHFADAPRAPRRAGTVQLLFHLRERRSNDVVMMHVRTDGLDGVEPHAVNQIEIAGRERRRMRAEVIGVGASAAVMDDEPDVERLRACRRAPRRRRAGAPDRRPTASTTRRRSTSDERSRRIVATMRVDDVLGGHDRAGAPGGRCRSASADDLPRAAAAPPASACASLNRRSPTSTPSSRDGHDDDVAIAAASAAPPPRARASADCAPARATTLAT